MNQDTTTPEVKVKKARKLTTSQQIIIKHVAFMEHNKNSSDWAREGKICSTLSKKYGSEFLLWLTPSEGFKVNSLAYYYSVMGKNHLSDQLVEYKKLNASTEQKKQDIPLSNTKIGEDICLSTRPKTLKDFLNYGKEIRTIRTTSTNI